MCFKPCKYSWVDIFSSAEHRKSMMQDMIVAGNMQILIDGELSAMISNILIAFVYFIICLLTLV
jgi:hypothetical protein